MILDGKALAAKLRQDMKVQVERLKAQGITPGLLIFVVGNDAASQVYTRNKRKACEELGIYFEQENLPQDISQDELIRRIQQANSRKEIHGLLVQLPLPKNLDEKAVIQAVDPNKDVDAFHMVNVGRIMFGDYDFLPCTPAGIMKLIQENGISVRGKECVVIGRSNIVGKPMAMLLLHEHGTVTICHSQTPNLQEIARRADILVSAVGKAKLITGDMVKPGAVVIDVGMNRDGQGKLCGDVDFQQVEPIASAITPVPGGVGPMTVAMLMENTITAAKRFQSQLTQGK